MSDKNPLKELYKNLSRVVYCNNDALLLTLTTLLSKGHMLIEDAPGLGKTTLARALAKSISLDMKRVQCTPDLMPSDITGISIYNQTEHKFEFIKGPVFTNILLSDEINRATPRTQSALLEAMAEGTVSIDRETYKLPDSFMVIATQNPVEFGGTYPLPEAQLDRFFMRFQIGYPTKKQEKQIMVSQESGHPLDGLESVITENQLKVLQQRVEKMPMTESIYDYITDIVSVTRSHPKLKLGSSPRGSLALMRASRAFALLKGKKSVTPGIIQELLEPVLSHRLIFKDTSLLDIEARKLFWKDILETVPVPDFAKN